MATFVFDTYAIFEIIKGNKNYEKYVSSTPIINDFILAELSYNLLKEFDSKTATGYTGDYAPFSLRVNSAIINSAMEFRYKNKKRKMSATDCISYFQAQSLGVKFLTGDKEFKTRKNAEFVK